MKKKKLAFLITGLLLLTMLGAMNVSSRNEVVLRETERKINSETSGHDDFYFWIAYISGKAGYQFYENNSKIKGKVTQNGSMIVIGLLARSINIFGGRFRIVFIRPKILILKKEDSAFFKGYLNRIIMQDDHIIRAMVSCITFEV